VSIDGSDLAVWIISIRNEDAGWVFNTTVPYVAAGLSAEWIEEAPLSIGALGQSTLANFGSVDFSNLSANGVNPGLDHGTQVELVDPSGRILARPSNSNGDSFSVCYGSDFCH